MTGGVGIVVTPEGDQAIARALQRLRTFLSGPQFRDALDEIGARLEASTQHRFETETGPDGVPWPPSHASYDRGPAAGGLGNTDRGQTLTDTGRLRASITRIVGDDVLRVGTNVVYAAIHQLGGKTPPHTIRAKKAKALAFPGADGETIFRRSVNHPGSKVPARPFLGVSASDERAVLRIVNARLEALWR